MHAYFYIVDNGTREGLDKFLKAASSDPETVLHYEFMQDYKVWFLCILLFAFYYFGPKYVLTTVLAINKARSASVVKVL